MLGQRAPLKLTAVTPKNQAKKRAMAAAAAARHESSSEEEGSLPPKPNFGFAPAARPGAGGPPGMCMKDPSSRVGREEREVKLE